MGDIRIALIGFVLVIVLGWITPRRLVSPAHTTGLPIYVGEGGHSLRFTA